MADVKRRRNRWVLDFYDENGKRCWKTMPKGTIKEDAQDELNKILKRIKHGNYTSPKKLPVFSFVADLWLTAKEPSVRHSTHYQYRGHVENYIKPYFKKVKINQVNFDGIERFKEHCLKEKRMSAPMVCKLLVTLSQIMSYAVRCRYIDYNPVREVEKPKRQVEEAESDAMDFEEMNVLNPTKLQALFKAGTNLQEKVLFMAAALTGLRQGELLGLQWGDIDWTTNQILVRRTFNHGRYYTPKSKRSKRRVDLAPEMVTELKRWKLACPPSEHDLVFPSSTGTPKDATNMLRREFFPALRRAGLPKIRFHDLRHTYASLLIDQKENPKYIQTQLGHASINMTMDIYGHLFKQVNAEAATKLGRAVFGENKNLGSNSVADRVGR